MRDSAVPGMTWGSLLLLSSVVIGALALLLSLLALLAFLSRLTLLPLVGSLEGSPVLQPPPQ